MKTSARRVVSRYASEPVGTLLGYGVAWSSGKWYSVVEVRRGEDGARTETGVLFGLTEADAEREARKMVEALP